MDLAPFRADLALGPTGACAYWTRATDGVKLRLGHYPAEGDRGTVLLFPGRTEYVEKYGLTAQAMAEAGYHTLTIDWRGQGLADRLLPDERTGHVHFFEDYQKDVAAMLEAAEALDLPRPWHLLAHSMGACIGLRSVMDGMRVASCVFTGPMWGIRIASAVRPAAWALGWGSRHLGLGHVVAPGTKSASYVANEPFEDNQLTTDPEMFDYMRRQVIEEPKLQLGGPSLRWLHQSLRECRTLARRQSPDLPCITFLGSNERIVDTTRVHARMAHWPRGRLELVPNAEHEVLMEGPLLRRHIHSTITDHFDGARPANAAKSA